MTTLWTSTKESKKRLDEFLRQQDYISTYDLEMSELSLPDDAWDDGEDDEDIATSIEAKGDPSWVEEAMRRTPEAVLRGVQTKALDTDPDPSPKPSAARLRRYWTKGRGALKIAWGTPGDFNRCVAQLGKYVAEPKGLCNVYHQSALGAPPGKGH